MRAGLSTIQQTLTPEAAAVLNQSIAEASRRSHGQTTPLHVASTLLASPSGYLRQACVRSHPNSSHPLQCRALELCFSVALERLPAATSNGSSSISEPPISNALMAALKRAQAHQRRGCPEQQQQPLLAVKVELEQLIISILDDPSVSRVMREASFSSPAVKAVIEQSMASTSSSSPALSSSSPPTSNSGGFGGLGSRPLTASTALLPANKNAYINPRLQQQNHVRQQQQQPETEDEVKKVLDVLLRSNKKNPVLVGDSEPESLLKEVLRRIEKRAIDYGILKNAHIISLDRELFIDSSHTPKKMNEQASSIQALLDGSGGCVILNLGDLKWLVENSFGSGASPISKQIQQQQLVSEIAKIAVAEVAKLIAKFREVGRVMLMGTASCATYMRCQVYHPSMEIDWDLQAVPIAPRKLMPTSFPRSVGNGILSSSVESLAPLRGFATSLATAPTLMPRHSSEDTDSSQRKICPACTENYERELAKLVAKEFEKSSKNFKPDVRPLPPWLQAAKLSSENANLMHDPLQTKQELKWKQNTEELLKRWQDTCLCLHPSFHQPIMGYERSSLGATALLPNSYGSKIISHEPFQPKLPPVQSFITPLQMNNNRNSRPMLSLLKPQVSPAGSPVRTELALGLSMSTEPSRMEQNHKDRIKDISGGCTQDFFLSQQMDKISSNSEADCFKHLIKGLTEKIGWQPEAASSVAITVTQCRSGNGKRRPLRARADTWLLFLGPDRVGKKKMASTLSELIFGTDPAIIGLGANCGGWLHGEDGVSNMGFRKKTTLDHIAEAVRQNPFSVFVIEDVDHADVLVRGRIKQAIESGRLSDSHGREISLGGAIFIMTADSLPESIKNSSMDSLIKFEEKLEVIANCRWQMELVIGDKSGKHCSDWLNKDVGRSTKPRTEPGMTGLSLDLNLSTSVIEEETGEGSRNSSDLTVELEHEHEQRRLAVKPLSTSLPVDMIDVVDDTIMFKPVDFSSLHKKVTDAVIHKFNSVTGSEQGRLQVDTEVIEQIVACIWFGGMEAVGFDEWLEKVLMPCFKKLKSSHVVIERSIVKLVPVKEESTQANNILPSAITIVCNELYD